MDSELLQKACEKAGLKFSPGDETTGVPNYWHDPSTLDKPMHGGTFGWEEDDPALPSYVADLLVAKAWPRSTNSIQRIKAAMEVLKS